MAADTDPRDTADRPVVTLFGRVGSGVEAVGARVAAALGMPYHPQAFSSDTIAGAPGADAQERATLTKVIELLGAAFGDPEHSDEAELLRLRDELVARNTEQVRRHAAEGGVIVGRNGALILAGRPNTLHVQLTGDDGACYTRAAADTGLPLERAAVRAQREDEVRADMSLVLYGWDPRDPARYDLVIDTGRVPLAGAVEAIAAAVRTMITESAGGPDGGGWA